MLTGTAEKLIAALPASPTDVSSKREIKKIQQFIPVPTDYHILWADIQNYGGYPCGIVITEEALILKAPKDSVTEENKRRKQENSELKKSGVKDKSKMQAMLTVLYHIVPWEYFETSLYSLSSVSDEKSKPYYYVLKYGDGEIARFSNPSIHKFFLDYAAEEKRIANTIQQVRSSSTFSGLGTLDLDNTAFHAAYGADQSKTGHGIYAEHAGSMLDRLHGEDSKTVGQDLDENGRYLKNGPDKIVDGAAIQCKYCKTAGDSVRACFSKNSQGLFEYRYYDADGNPMAVEVAKDQYEKAVEAMRRRIENGQVPGVDDPNLASSLIRRGKLTKQQARNLAKAGTFESITYDAVTGVVTCTAICGLSALATFGIVYWKTKGDLRKASEAALRSGWEVFGASFLARMVSSQIARTGLSRSLIPVSKQITKSLDPQLVQRLVNAFRSLVGRAPIYGGAAQNSFAKALRTTAVSQAIMFAVFSVPDTYKVFAGKISTAQYTKEMTSLVASMGGYFVGSAAAGLAVAEYGRRTGEKVDKKVGGAIGFVAGAVAGTGANAAVRALGNLFHEDDAIITTRLFNATFANICIDYMLSENEIGETMDKLDEKDNRKGLRKLQGKLISSDTQHEDIESFLDPIIEDVISKRPKITAAIEHDMIVYMDEEICEAVEKGGDLA